MWKVDFASPLSLGKKSHSQSNSFSSVEEILINRPTFNTLAKNVDNSADV